MAVTVLLSYASDGTATQGCTGYGKIAQPRGQSIEVLSHHEEVDIHVGL
jgi:hypothetical protein